MKISKIELNNVKSFQGLVSIDFDKDLSMFAFSGMNGAGKSTLLKIPWLIQKAHFVELLNQVHISSNFKTELHRYLNNQNSYIKLTLVDEAEVFDIKLSRNNNLNGYEINYSDRARVDKFWNLNEPKDLILYVDASKGFSEKTLTFNEINIEGNVKSNLTIEAIMNPESLFSGIYRQLIKDYVHDRLIPNKPDRLLYYHIAGKLFTQLIPNIELSNFSGNHKAGEFVLLGRANKNKFSPLYDVREFSSGEKALLSTLTFLCISNSVGALIIDEPENHFHESLLLEFISILYQLCNKGGLLSWLSDTKTSGKAIKLDWIESEYKDHNLNQVMVSTHSKSLIYKFFSIGQNFIISNGISKISYDEAESELRKIGLSTTYSKVILVEGTGDNEALEYIVKDKNLKIKPLHGSTAVIETFKKLSSIKNYIQDTKFVFLVDSDNKSSEYFETIRSIDTEFYDATFIKLDRHEFENYFLNENIFRMVMDRYSAVSNSDNAIIDCEYIKNKLIEYAKESLPQVYKKELSLSFQQLIEVHFSNHIWGNRSFDWNTIENIKNQLENDVLISINMLSLKDILNANAENLFDSYKIINDEKLLKRCDGKQVFGKSCNHFASKIGVNVKIFKKAIYNWAYEDENSEVSKLVSSIISRFT